MKPFLRTFLLLPFVCVASVVWAQGTTVTDTFNYTGGAQTFVVPLGVDSITIDMYGAQGGGGNGYPAIGGQGGRLQAKIQVTPGETLTIHIGGAGQNAVNAPGAGGYNGGGNGAQAYSATYTGGGGGGASDIRSGGTALANRIAVAGGGGGGGRDGGGTEFGGDGGGTTAQPGAIFSTYGDARAGGAGSPSAGGAGGIYGGWTSGTGGVLGTGGNAGEGGGGGGGGYYGGGGGSWGGGGGGSSFSSASISTDVTHTQGVQNGNGLLYITYSSCSLPTIPTTYVNNGANRLTTITNFNINSSSQNVQYVAPGSTVSISFSYTIANGGTFCPGCVVQQYVGLSDGSFLTCYRNFGGYCNCSGTHTASFTAPSTPGIYYFRHARTLNFSCQTPGVGGANMAAIIVRESFTATSTDETCIGAADGTASVSPDNSTTGNAYFWSTGETTASISGLAPGTYYVTSSDAYNCAEIDTVIIGTVPDVTPPTVVTTNPTVFLDASGNGSIVPADVDGGSTDNCLVDSLALNDSTFDCTDLASGTSAVILTVYDNSGNSAQSAATVFIIDTVSPVAAGQALTVYLDQNGADTVSALDVDNGSTDNCAIESYTLDDSIFTCADLGTVNVTLTVTDSSSNTDDTTVVLTIVDTIRPNAIAQDDTVYLDANGTYTLTPADIDNGSFDNCSFTLSVDTFNFSCVNVGTPLTVTLYAQDAVNIDSTTATVTVLDTISPIVVTTNPTVYLDGTGNASITSADVNNGSSDSCGIISLSLDDSTFDCTDVGAPVTVTLTAVDSWSNSSSGTATVTVLDSIDPTAAGNDTTLFLDALGQASITGIEMDSASSDNCGIVSYSLSDSTFDCSDAGNTISVTLTVGDGNGNNDTDILDVTVLDNTNPVVIAHDTVVYLDANGAFTLIPADIDDGSSDICGITLSIDTANFSCENVGTPVTVTLTGTDPSGNSSTDVATVTVLDSVSPVVITSNFTVQLDSFGDASITSADINAGSYDSCGIISISLDDSIFNCSDVGPNTVTLTVVDENSNSSSATATVTVQDLIAPIVLANDTDLFLDATGNISVSALEMDSGSNDACGIASYVLSDSLFDCADADDTLSVTLTVTDSNGNSNSTLTEIRVFDNIIPTVLAHDTFVFLDAFGQFTLLPSHIDDGSFDNCGINLSIDTSAFDCENTSDSVLVTLTGVDPSGNSASTTAMVAVIDTVRPVASTTNIPVQLGQDGTASIVPADIDNSSSDACGIASRSLDISTFDCGDVGSPVTVELLVIDSNGNADSATAIVTVFDTVSPTVITQTFDAYLDSTGFVTITAFDVNDNSWDSCGIKRMYLNDSVFDCSVVDSTLTVILTVDDQNGNSNSATASVNIIDTIPANVATNDTVTYLDASGQAFVTSAMVNNGTYDNCFVSVELSDSLFDCNDALAPVPILLIATDQTGNVASDTAMITVLDTIRPVVVTQNITVAVGTLGTVSITSSMVNGGSSDNCSLQSLTLSQNTFTCADTVAPQPIYLIGTDPSGNVDSAIAFVTVVDTSDPTVVTMPTTVILDINGNGSITFNDINNGSGDNCTTDSIWISQSTFDCSEAGTNVIDTLFVRDVSGNVSFDTTLVTVVDNIPPTIVTQNLTIELDEFGMYSITPDSIDDGTNDACGVALLEISQSDFDCSDLGVNNIIFTATDDNGNSDSVTVTVTVLDNIAPELDYQNTFTLYLDANGQTGLTAQEVDINTNDACGVDSIWLSDTAFDCSHHGDTIYALFSAQDSSLNISTDTVTIFVLDTILPTVQAMSDTVFLDSFGVDTLPYQQLNDSTFDNCGIALMYLSDSTFDCSTVDSTISIWYIAVDSSGNADSLEVQIHTRDEINPILTVPDTIEVANDSGDCGAIVGFSFPTATDNCSIHSIVQVDNTGLDSGSFFPVGITILEYVAYDQSGNMDSNQFAVIVRDTQAPVVLCPPDTEICDTTFLYSLPPYIDNCFGFPVTLISGIDSGDFYPVGVTINEFQVIDSDSNIGTCQQEILRWDFPDAADAGPDQENCEVYSATLDGNDPVVGFGVWSVVEGEGVFSDSLNRTAEITGLTPDTTTLEWRIENGVCPIERDSMIIIEYLLPEPADAGPDQFICDTNQTFLASIPDELGTGTWFVPTDGTIVSDSSITNPLVSNLVLGSYTYTWKMENGVCPVTTDDVVVNVVPYPVVDAGESKYLFFHSDIELEATADLDVSYSWEPKNYLINDTNRITTARPIQSTIFTVYATTQYGCTTSDTVSVFVDNAFEFPTAFTPDGDGVNDVWNLRELESYPSNEVRVYNRWGHVIFESKGYATPWDGTFNGEELPTGAYFFTIDFGEKGIIPMSGSITIIR